MIRLCGWTSALLVSFTLVLLGVRGIGARDGASTTTSILGRGADECPPEVENCWHGIQPGQMTTGQAMAILAKDSLFTVDEKSSIAAEQECWSASPDREWRMCASYANNPTIPDKIRYMWIEPPWDTYSLGDAILRFGQPIGSVICNPVYAPIGGIRYMRNRMFIGAILDFKEGIYVLAYNPWNPQALEVTPDMIVLRVMFYPDVSPYLTANQPWIGFSRRTFTTGCGV